MGKSSMSETGLKRITNLLKINMEKLGWNQTEEYHGRD